MNSICFITRTPSWGGAEKHTANLINYLLLKGYKIELVSCRHNLYSDYLKQWEGKLINSIYTDLDIYDKGPKAIESWSIFLKNVNSNFLILPKGGPYWGSFDFLSLCRERFSTIIDIVHNMTPRPPRNPISYLKGLVWGQWRWWYRDIFATTNRSQYANTIIAVNAEVKQNLIKYNKYPNEKVIIVDNGIDWWNFKRNEYLAEEFKKKHNLPLDCFIFGMVTRLDLTKGIDLSIDAFSKLLKINSGKKVHLVIVGEGLEKESLQRKAISLNIENKVTFIGFLKDPLPAFSAFNALLMPSRMEGLPLTLLEGMAAGCIPIVSRIGGMPTVVGNTSGIIIEPNSVNDLADAMEEIRGYSNEKRFVMQDQIVEKIMTQYDQNKACETILSIINNHIRQ